MGFVSYWYWGEIRYSKVATAVYQECYKQAADYAHYETKNTDKISIDDFERYQFRYELNYNSYVLDCLQRMGFKKEARKIIKQR